MRALFNMEIKVLNRNLDADDAGGDFITYEESETPWRVRVSTLDGNYIEDIPGREYPSMIRIVGDVRDDVREGDRIEYGGFSWELTNVITVTGIGSIPDYIRARATRIGEGVD